MTGLSLPEGVYTLLIYADLNRDQVFDQSEIVGKRELALDTIKYPEKIVKNLDIKITKNSTIAWAEAIFMPEEIEAEQLSLHTAQASTKAHNVTQ